MLKNIKFENQESEIAQSTNNDAVSLDGAKGFACVVEATVSTPSAKTFTAAASDIITIASHGFKTGLKGQVSTSGVLPAGLAAATDYFVIVVSANTIKLASSLNNANAGTAVDITDAGTGTHTFTATALAGASVKLQATVDSDSETWIDLSGISQNITTTANYLLLEKVDPMYRKVRAVFTMTAGQLDVAVKYLLKGEE